MAQVFSYVITSARSLPREFLEECKPLNETEEIKLSLDPLKGIVILASKKKSLLDYACDEFIRKL
jgi:hypothetical protein